MTQLFTERLPWLFRFGLLCCLVGEACGQDDSESARPEVETTVTMTPGGSLRFVPGHWGLIESQIRNSGDSQQTVRSLAWFDDDPSLQFGRDAIVPPHSVRRTWFTVRAPAGSATVKSLDITFGQHFKDPNAPLAEKQGDSRAVVNPRSRPRALWVGDGDDAEVRFSDLVKNARDQILPGLVVLKIPGEPLPPVEAAWDIADAVILTGDRIGHDGLAQSALLGWVRRGGRLWIPLDLIEPEIIQDMLGDRLQLDVIGRTSLNQFQVVSTRGTPPAAEQETVVETPIDLVRVAVDGAEVTHTLNGWPAGIELQFGRGQVMITTASLSAWVVHPRELVDQSQARKDGRAHVTPAATELFQAVFGKVRNSPIEESAIEEYVSSRVGYQTPSRGLIGGLLGGFITLAVLVMRILRGRDKAGWILGLIPVLSIGAAAILIVFGSASRSAPPGQQVFQFIESESGSSDVVVSGAMAIYSDSDFSPRLGTRTGAEFLPDRRGMLDARWRMTRSDLNAWNTEGVEFRPGVRIAQFQSRTAFDRPMRASGTFTADGFSGRLESPLSSGAEDALVASRTQVTLPVGISADGDVVPGGSILPPGEFIAESVVSAEQTRRQNMMRELFRTESRNSPVVTRPSLLFWSPALDLQSGDLDEEQTVGSALVMLPIELERPAAGTPLTIPAPFISYRSVPKSRSLATPAFFSNSLGTWTEYPRAGQINLHFQLPPELLPLEAESAMLTFKVTASSRDVLVTGVDPSTPAGDFTSPVGVKTVELDQSQFELTPSGAIPIEFSIGEATDESDPDAQLQDRYWKMDWVQFEFHGRTK